MKVNCGGLKPLSISFLNLDTDDVRRSDEKKNQEIKRNEGFDFIINVMVGQQNKCVISSDE